MTLRVVSTPLAGSSLTKLALSGASTPWFVSSPHGADQWRARASTIRESLLHANWLESLAPAFGAAAPERLARAAESGFVVTAGQQPGLFGGPLYTWWKALSALALADELEKATGLPVAPVFWAATDDSDFAEASRTVVVTSDGAEQIEMEPRKESGIPLSRVPLGDISREIQRLEAATGSAPSSGILDLVRHSCSHDATIGSAYVGLLRSILEPMGIAVLDAAHDAVRTAAHPLLVQALEQSETIDAALLKRAEELDAAGHSVQVKTVDGRSLVFSEKDGKRGRVRVGDAAEAAKQAVPGSLGPNVLLRPIVECAILPTVGYLGGPAEIAYFAQVTAVASALGVPAPLGLPRWSGFVVEPRIDRILERYHLTIDDFRDPHAVETRLARSSLPDQLAKRIAELREALERTTSEPASAEEADLAPPNVPQGLRRNVEHRVERLERRFAAGVKRRGNSALRDAAIARGALFPFGKPQERALNIVPLLARYGDALIADVLDEIRSHAAGLA